MDIKDFVRQFKNYPVLFIGTGVSLRYYKDCFTWENLLKKIACEFKDEEYFLELKGLSMTNNSCNFELLASKLEETFEEYCRNNRNGKFKEINDKYFDFIRDGIKVTRLKIYVAELFQNLTLREEKIDELNKLQHSVKNVSSIITTNYDQFIEKELNFVPLIGNDILLSNPYGAVYKIHGSVENPEKIILTCEDYIEFNKKYELIRAQLLSLFIHHPIVFLGYSINDDNIKKILKTIFSYVDLKSKQANQIRNNFLLVEYDKDSTNINVVEHDIELNENQTIRINKLKTDNFVSLYEAIEELNLPVSVMDIRKVQNIVKEIYEGGNIKVTITDDLEELPNSERILAIGKKENIYIYKDCNDLMIEYFDIIDNNMAGIIKSVEKQHISSRQFFPAFGFYSICSDATNLVSLKKQQSKKIIDLFKKYDSRCKKPINNIDDILNQVSTSWANTEIAYQVYIGKIDLEATKDYLINIKDKKSTDYRRLLTVYDYKKYSGK